jgi:thiamine transporter ThiT
MKNSIMIKRLVGLATLCSIAFVLQFWIAGILPKLPIGGGTAINLALIPVVVGAFLYGPVGGLTVGLFLGAVTLLPGQGAERFYVNWYMTILAIVLCLAKTGLAGFLSGLAFKLLFKKNYYVAIYAAAIIAPIVNTGTFLLLYGALINIMTGSAYGPTFVATAAAVWIVFLVELAVNILFAPALATLTKTLTRNYDLGFVDYLKKYSSENSLDEAVDTEEIVEA